VRHGIAIAPELWPYSNYPEWIGVRNGTLVDQAFIHAHWADRKRYQQFVNDYLIGQSSLPLALRTYLQQLEAE
jgi:hypothetical protein